jgi:hypothetical protein
LREIAERNTEKVRTEIRERLRSKGKGIDRNFQEGTIVTISVPPIDRHSMDRALLPCKIIERTNGKYRLGCASGILNVTYGANALNLVGLAEFPELNEIPQRRISVREAARGQSLVRTAPSSQVRCNCKGACADGRCSCRKTKQKCTTQCHKDSAKCLNY